MDDLMPLVQQIVPFHMRHNAEPEACDLCIELERLDLLHPHVDATNAGRTALYLWPGVGRWPGAVGPWGSRTWSGGTALGRRWAPRWSTRC